MKFPKGVKVYGDINYRDKKCPLEGAEQGTFFNVLREEFPDTYGIIATHIKNEGKRTPAQIARERSQGFVTGACDIVIPGNPSFTCELKRKDHTQSKLEDKQENYLVQSAKAGSFACIALGYEAAWQAFTEWREIIEK